jgi:hypothetical protein
MARFHACHFLSRGIERTKLDKPLARIQNRTSAPWVALVGRLRAPASRPRRHDSEEASVKLRTIDFG